MSRFSVFLVLFNCLTCLVLFGLSVMCAEHDAPLFAIAFAGLSLLPVRAIRAVFDDEAAEMERRARVRPAPLALGLAYDPIPPGPARAAAITARTECDAWWSSLGEEHDDDCPQAARWADYR